MRRNGTINSFIGFEEGTNVVFLPTSSSLYRKIIKSHSKTETSSTDESNQAQDTNRLSYQTNNFKRSTTPISFGAEILDYIARTEAEARDKVVSQYANEIRVLIRHDDFVDGEMSESEHFVIDAFKCGKIDYIVDALMSIYSSCFGDPHMLEGVLTMISCVPYEAVAPKGPIMAMGLLTNKELSVRDKAIQCFEKWNSKKGLTYLRNIECSPAWLQRYVDKVIMYIERDGNE